MPRYVKPRSFQAEEEQRALVRRELDIFLEALSHDTQFAIRRACRLLAILDLPKRLAVKDQIRRLSEVLAKRRERSGWGRPWSYGQLQRAYYAKNVGFRRVPPMPVTREELARYTPTIPPAERARAAEKEKQDAERSA